MNTNTKIYIAWITYILIRIIITLIMMIVASIVIKISIEGVLHIISKLLSSPNKENINTNNREIK
jgi:hypothetical protein